VLLAFTRFCALFSLVLMPADSAEEPTHIPPSSKDAFYGALGFVQSTHWQACFLIAMKIRLSTGTAAPASVWLLCYAAE
jgi:hypothetical protein